MISLGIGSLYEKKFSILDKLETSLMLKFYLQNTLQRFESLFLIWCEICVFQIIFGTKKLITEVLFEDLID